MTSADFFLDRPLYLLPSRKLGLGVIIDHRLVENSFYALLYFWITFQISGFIELYMK